MTTAQNRHAEASVSAVEGVTGRPCGHFIDGNEVGTQLRGCHSVALCHECGKVGQGKDSRGTLSCPASGLACARRLLQQKPTFNRDAVAEGSGDSHRPQDALTQLFCATGRRGEQQGSLKPLGPELGSALNSLPGACELGV